MPDPRMVNLANILVNYSVAIQPGDWVLVNGTVASLPLVREVVRQVLKAGGHTTTLLGDGDLQEIALSESSDEQLQWVSPVSKLLMEEVDARISIMGSSNTRALTGVDPAKQRLSSQAYSKLFKTFMKRSAEGSLRWTGTQYPCQAYAQDAEMSLREYEDFVYKATFADQDDPVAEWLKVHDEQQKMVDWLVGKDKVEVRGPEVDLTLSIKDRTFINSDGKKNMPSGEIFTGPVEDSVNGWIKFTYPAISGGREVEGVRLEFEEGKVVKAEAEKNQNFLLTMLDSDEGARYLGEFAVGTNYGIDRFTKSILFDEKIGGTIHLAVGAGYPETGSKNESAIHWDFICDMRTDSEILVDGELFYKNGEFQV